MEKDILYYSRKLAEGESLQCAKRNKKKLPLLFSHSCTCGLRLRSLFSEIRNIPNMRLIGRMTGPNFQSK